LPIALAAIANREGSTLLSGMPQPLVTCSMMMEGVRFQLNGSTLH